MITMEMLIDILHKDQCSLVVADSDGMLHTYHGRGVKDLYGILDNGSGTLSGAMLADKVIGKGAAALMAAGGVTRAHGDVVSAAARKLLEHYGIRITYNTLTDSIINRSGTGPCPVEHLLEGIDTAAECVPLIAGFLNGK